MRMTLCHIRVNNMAIGIKNTLKGRPAKNPTKRQITAAIKSTQSMKMASEYLNMSYQTFKKYAKMYDLWNPLPSSAGIRKRNSTKITPYDFQKILSGENPSPFRETTLLKRAFQEGYLEQKCSNCGCDYTHITDTSYPLLLDFFDKDHLNTKIENLRVLCLNCVYQLQTTIKGWYRHRDVPLMQVIEEQLPLDISVEREETAEIIPALEVELEPIEDKQPDLEYIPFEEFQKSLEN